MYKLRTCATTEQSMIPKEMSISFEEEAIRKRSGMWGIISLLRVHLAGSRQVWRQDPG